MTLNDRMGTAPLVVLDTNAVLDAWVFRDPCMSRWSRAIECWQVRWLACRAMRDELVRILVRPQLAHWNPDAERVLDIFDRLSVACAQPPSLGWPGLICTDPDDQVFLDLGLTHGARWLLTKDRALLRLARPALRHGLVVVRPSAATLALPDARC